MDINFGAPIMTLRETVVARINGYRVGCGNILQREYQTPEGETKEGITMRLSVAHSGEQIIVGQGSTFSIEGTQWKVLEITPKSPEKSKGEMVIEQVVEGGATERNDGG